MRPGGAVAMVMVFDTNHFVTEPSLEHKGQRGSGKGIASESELEILLIDGNNA